MLTLKVACAWPLIPFTLLLIAIGGWTKFERWGVIDVEAALPQVILGNQNLMRLESFHMKKLSY